jgi:hypothetical protein
MKTNIILALCVAATAALFSACGGPAANTANANKPANANANTAANTNAAAANTNTASNTAAAPATDGQVIKIEEAGIQMTVPKGFKFSKDGEDTIVKSEDEGVDIRFTVPKDGDYDTIVTDAAKEIDSYLDDVKVTQKGTKGTQDGMDITSLSGTAKNQGEEVGWELTIIKAPKKPVLVNIYVEKTSVEKESKKVAEFFKSIKKM